jgi:hypothetical protein
MISTLLQSKLCVFFVFFPPILWNRKIDEIKYVVQFAREFSISKILYIVLWKKQQILSKKTKIRATILPNCEKNPPNFSEEKKKQRDPQISRSPTRKIHLQL